MSMNPHKIANLSVLLNETPTSYYWMGFLIADGHFYNRGAIKLHLSEKDREQINKFRRFVHYSGKAKTCTMNAMNPTVVHKIMNKFHITNLKTYNPCSIRWIEGDLLFSLIVGMFDGDGNIRWRNNSVSALEMKLHKNWFENLRFIESFLYEYLKVEKSKNVSLTRLRKDGYSVIILSDRYLLALIRKKSEELKIPFMKRKLGKVDADYVSPYREYRNRVPKILELINCGMKQKDIAKTLSVTPQVVATTVYREKQKSNENLDNC